MDVTGKVPAAGFYVFVVHLNQPTQTRFNLSVLLQNGQMYEASVAVPFCPSNSGCRAVVEQADGNRNFMILENFVLTLTAPANRSVWVDYVYVVPSQEFTAALMQESPIDMTSIFLARCGKNNLVIDADSPAFCRQVCFHQP